MQSQPQQQIPNLAYRQFVDTCKSSSTRGLYVKTLKYFMSYLHLPPGAYDKLLEMDPKIIQMNICDYVTHLRNNGRSHQTVSVYIAAIRHFYDMNDVVTINWKKVHSFEGEHEKIIEDRPYTHSEISTMLQNTTMRNQAIILLMTSSGPRVGAIPQVRIKDMEPIDKHNIYKLTYYPNSKKNCYFSFCSTEARKQIDAYLSWRERLGEKLKPETPLFRTEFNMLEIQRPQVLNRKAIQFLVNKLLKSTGPEESIVTGLYTLALMPITVFISSLPGINTGSLLEPGGTAANFVVFATRRGDTTSLIVFLSRGNVTVCGFGTSVGLYHVTLSPAFISTFWGTNILQGAVAFPPPYIYE